MQIHQYKKQYDEPEWVRNKRKLEAACKHGQKFLTAVYKEADADGPQRTVAISFNYLEAFEREIRHRTGGVRGDLRSYTDWFKEIGPNTRKDKGEKPQVTYIDIKTDLMVSDSLMRDFNNGLTLGEEDLKRIHKWKLIKPYYERWLTDQGLSPLVTSLYEYMTMAKIDNFETHLTEELCYTINDYGISTVQDLARYDYKKAKHAETFDDQMLLGEPGENLTEKIVQAAAKWMANKQKGDIAVTQKLNPVVLDEKDKKIKELQTIINVAGIKDEKAMKDVLPDDLEADQLPEGLFNDPNVVKQVTKEQKKTIPQGNNIPKAQKPTTNKNINENISLEVKV